MIHSEMCREITPFNFNMLSSSLAEKYAGENMLKGVKKEKENISPSPPPLAFKSEPFSIFGAKKYYSL